MLSKAVYVLLDLLLSRPYTFVVVLTIESTVVTLSNDLKDRRTLRASIPLAYAAIIPFGREFAGHVIESHAENGLGTSSEDYGYH